MELVWPAIGIWLLIWSIVSLATMVLWVLALVSILRNEFPGANDKLIWVLIVIFLPFIGAILYFLVGRNQRIKHNQV